MESADTKKKCPGSEPGDSGLSSQPPVGGAAARMANPVGNQAGTIRSTGTKVKIKKYKDKIVLILILILVTLDKYTSVGKMFNTLTTTEIYLNELAIICKKYQNFYERHFRTIAISKRNDRYNYGNNKTPNFKDLNLYDVVYKDHKLNQ